MRGADTIYIYLIGGSDGPIKIGHAQSPGARLKTLQRERDDEIRVLGTWPIAKYKALAVERYVQWHFRDRHYFGEWYNIDRAEAEATIDRALTSDISARYPIPPVDRRGREMRYGETATTKFPAGTMGRIAALCGGADGRADFIREAIERELKRRERAAKK